MKNEQTPHFLNIFPTGDIPVPVSIGDLPLSDYVISDETLTEIISTHLENNPHVPGAIIHKNGKIVGMIPRHKMFERLGHRYGIELFFKKPIIDLERELETRVFVLKSHISINMAVKLALSRAQAHIYDPIIVEFENKSMRLLDIYVLLLSQSQLSNNLSGIISSLNNIEMILTNQNADPSSTLDLIMESMSRVIPTHHARVILQSHAEFHLLRDHDLVLHQDQPLGRISIYRSILQNNQPSVLEDVQMVPAWSNQDTPPNTRSWMGIPLIHQNEPLGLLSLSRVTFSPFSNHEKETTLVFARYLTKLLTNSSARGERIRVLERKY